MSKERIHIWANYRQSSPEFQAECLKAFDAELQDMPPNEFVGAFSGAPADVVMAYLPDCDPDIQVQLWKTALPVTSRAAARKHLKREAMEKLGLVPKIKSRWLKAMCLDR